MTNNFFERNNEIFVLRNNIKNKKTILDNSIYNLAIKILDIFMIKGNIENNFQKS